MTRERPGRPNVDHIDGRLRFRAELGMMGGRWYSVYDDAILDGQSRKLEHTSPAATHRVFVQPDTGRWTYAFTPVEAEDAGTRGARAAASVSHLPHAQPCRERSAINCVRRQ